MIRTLLATLLLALTAQAPAQAEPMLLAAASTGKALDAALAEGGTPALTSYGASGMLARQIEQGAPADVFLSANPKWMRYLVEAGLVRDEDVVTLMSNRLVLIAPAGAAPLQPEAMAARLEGEHFAMADPQTAPVGAYGKAALESLGLWGAAGAALVPMRNTLATVAAVASGEAALGLVYASDAAGQPGVTVVWTVPEDSHPPIRYLIAPVAQGEDPEGGAALIAYLAGPEGAAVLARFGFLPPEGD
ncbi:molybdate ABC transporter substrate-binding protein [Pseudooceanicola nanhaiensis]|uniref:molybdate ABC transporter substrate-binding protein n=1 Tax=Pseudooceanicola nanhaiensis TaxID=375761 RepID=UPI001CD2389A|nr:molybdate ABC transporter substrate-binding protein [Pseudooceanicola nanhaiensis]MCA0920167.1 molybdate ABC transporter substrate-binding protein [Pseudooceanicola nanhaiensis]